MRDIKVNGEVRKVCSETTSTTNNLHRVMLVFDDSILNVESWGACPDGDSIQELLGEPLKPNCFNERWDGIAKLKSGRKLQVVYWLTTLEAFNEVKNAHIRMEMARVSLDRERGCIAESDSLAQARVYHEWALQEYVDAKAQAFKQPATAPEARNPIEPRNKPLVTFSAQFKTVNCAAWPKSESRSRGRQANAIMQCLFENWRDNENRPIPVEELLKGQTIDRLDKALNKSKYPQTWNLIVIHAEEKSGKKTAMLSDSYDYQTS